MYFRRRIRAVEKKLGMEEPRELIIEFGNGEVFRINSEELTKLLQEISNTNDLKPPCCAHD